MNSVSTGVYLAVSLMILIPAGAGPRVLVEDVVWVSDLESSPDLIGKEIVLEGRFQGRIGVGLDQIRLKNCNPDKIEFRLEDKDPKFPSSLQYIRLNGTLTRAGGKLVMHVKSWSKVSTTDEERFRDAARRLSASDFRGWYELAGRMQRLADFYSEKELKALAEEARVRGFRAEENALRPSQYAELMKLASRAADVGLSADESRRMQHKALRWRLDSLAAASASAAQWVELADSIAQLLPGAKTPLTPAASKTITEYRTKPIEMYDTMPAARDACDREFWVDATARAMLAQSTAPNIDVAHLAKEAARLIPERPELAKQFLRQWAEAEALRATSQLPASQVRRLAETFRVELRDPKRAQEVLRQWLEARRKKLGTKDADGRVRLAMDFRADLKDNETAAKLLLEAVQIESDLPEAASELKALGYVKTPSGWKTGGDVPVIPEAQRTPSNRLPEKNMTPDQVRSIVGDPRPGDRIRFAYRKDGRVQVIEQWTYRGPPDLYVSFQVISGTEARVIAINTPPPK